MLHPVYGRQEGIQKSTRSHGTNVTMITHDKLSYLIISHLENGRKRNSTAANVQKSCLDNQCCCQWFPSRNTHNFAAAADSNSTWLFSHAKTSKTYPDHWLCTVYSPNYQRISAFCISCMLTPTNKNCTQHWKTAYSNSKGPKWVVSFSPLDNFQVSLQIGRIKQ